MSETLPKSWCDCLIGNIVGIQNGYAFKTKDFQSRGVPLIKQTNLIGDSVSVKECQYLDKKFLEERKSFVLKNGDILIGMSGSLGKVSVYRFDTPALQNQRTGKLVFFSDENIAKSLFLYYFTNIAYVLEKGGKGCGVQNISGTEIEELPFPLPPLNEQKRIVARLDQIMPRINAVKERLDKVPAIVKRFRQSVLTAAITGKLTEKWRADHPDVESAEVLGLTNKRIISHEEYRNMWNDFDIPESWNCISLSKIADLRLGKMLDGNKNIGKETKYIRNVNVRWFQFELDDLKTIKVQAEEIQKLSIKNGDVFICEGGEPGRAAVWQLGENKMTFQKALHRVRFNGKVVPDWLVYNLKVDADTDRLSELFTGSTIKHFTGRSLAEYPLALPPLEEQQEIVRQVDKLFALADRLESHYQKAKARVDKFSPSVLAKAFRGELVITEAELAEKEGRDFESAEKLLERILEEKARLVGSKQSAGGSKRKQTKTERKKK